MQQKVKFLIFDLGGVIINLNTHHTIEAFAQLTGKSTDFIINYSKTHEGFHQYEKGLISDADFREMIRDIAPILLTDEAIDKAWNAMILDLPTERITLLQRLKERYFIFLLSNTNNIHMVSVNKVRAESGIIPFDELFIKDYYSHQMGKRKPDADIFEQVLAENEMKAEEALFLDDNYDNIKGAANLGINTLHVTSPNLLFDYFDER
jgi:HAD superfamily hydrolase (TIGR01509 family)